MYKKIPWRLWLDPLPNALAVLSLRYQATQFGLQLARPISYHPRFSTTLLSYDFFFLKFFILSTLNINFLKCISITHAQITQALYKILSSNFGCHFSYSQQYITLMVAIVNCTIITGISVAMKITMYTISSSSHLYQ